MGIRWKVKREVEVEQDLLVREDGKSMVFDATIDDLRRACEAAGLVVETRESVEGRRADTEACIYALTHQGDRPATVLAGIHSMQRRLRVMEDSRDAWKREGDKVEAERDAARAEVASLEADLAAARARIAELEAPMPEATVRDLEALADEHFRLRSGWSPTLGDMRDLARAVAERVRRERPECIIARAVAGGVVSVRATKESDGWYVLVSGPRESVANDRVPDAEVRRVLARMLTEVGA